DVRPLLVALRGETVDGLLERHAGGTAALHLGERPAEVADGLEIGRVLLRAGLELVDRFVDLARVVLGEATILVAQPLDHVLDAARAVRVARGRNTRARQQDRQHRGDREETLVQGTPPWHAPRPGGCRSPAGRTWPPDAWLPSARPASAS